MPQILLEDESLRDGLQSEQIVLPLAEKIALFHLLVDAGVRRIQVGSFVNPRLVPQMADTHEFVQEVKNSPHALVTGLVLNRKGLQRAIASGLSHISLSASLSDTHSRQNVNQSSRDAMTTATVLIQEAKDAGLTVRAGAQCAFGYLDEAAPATDAVIATLGRFVTAGADEINLADTAGMANPLQVGHLATTVQKAFPELGFSLHLHDTRGLGIANMVAGYQAGVRIFDTCAGGLGGCPFIWGAAGNIPTEDAVNLFREMGGQTGIDLDKICRIADRFRTLLDRELPGRMSSVLRFMEDY